MKKNKKNILFILTATVVVLLGILTLLNYSHPKSATMSTGVRDTATSADNVVPDAILKVSDIQADPAAYQGTVTVTGVVAGDSKDDPKVFAIIDTAEAQACRSIGCANFYLPIRYSGAMPKQWDEINATGIFAKGGKEFEASKVEVVRHLKL